MYFIIGDYKLILRYVANKAEYIINSIMKFDKETIFYNYQMKGENCVYLLEFIYIPPNRSCWRITHWYISSIWCIFTFK